MRSIFLATAVCILFAAFSGHALAGGDSVGFVNLARLLSESEAGKEAIQEYQELLAKKKRSLDAKQKEYNELYKHVQANAATMGPDELNKMRNKLKELAREGKRMEEDAQEDLKQEDRILIARVLSKADKVLKEVAKKKGYKIILKDSKVIGYLDKDVDITDDVIKALNKKQ